MKDGILLIDKPEEHTSFDVIARLRGILRIRKLGHGGTLDPMATGVLPVFVGKATRLCDLIPNQDKRYTASFRLGQTTDTQDSTGKVLSQSSAAVPEAAVRALLPEFMGEQDQLPPMYSAVQVGGKRLYELARQGIEVERKPRRITVTRFDLLAYDPETREGVLDIGCSKGTYVRTLIGDLGERLGVGGVMTALRRTEACGYPVSEAITLTELEQRRDEGTLDSLILPIDTAFEDCPHLKLEEFWAKMHLNGVRIRAKNLRKAWLLELADTEQLIRVYSTEDEFLGVAQVCTLPDEEGEQPLLVPKKLFYERERL